MKRRQQLEQAKDRMLTAIAKWQRRHDTRRQMDMDFFHSRDFANLKKGIHHASDMAACRRCIITFGHATKHQYTDLHNILWPLSLDVTKRTTIKPFYVTPIPIPDYDDNDMIRDFADWAKGREGFNYFVNEGGSVLRREITKEHFKNFCECLENPEEDKQTKLAYISSTLNRYSWIAERDPVSQFMVDVLRRKAFSSREHHEDFMAAKNGLDLVLGRVLKKEENDRDAGADVKGPAMG